MQSHITSHTNDNTNQNYINISFKQLHHLDFQMNRTKDPKTKKKRERVVFHAEMHHDK